MRLQKYLNVQLLYANQAALKLEVWGFVSWSRSLLFACLNCCQCTFWAQLSLLHGLGVTESQFLCGVSLRSLCPALELGCSSCSPARTAGFPQPRWPCAGRSWGLALVQLQPGLFPSPGSGQALMGTCNAALWWIKLTLKLFPQSPVSALVFTKLQFSVLRAGIFKSVDNAQRWRQLLHCRCTLWVLRCYWKCVNGCH